MDRSGVWRLTPAYDVTFAAGASYTARHQMRIRDKVAGITRTDLMEVAQLFSIHLPGEIIEQVGAVVGSWPEYAARTDERAKGFPESERELKGLPLDYSQQRES